MKQPERLEKITKLWVDLCREIESLAKDCHGDEYILGELIESLYESRNEVGTVGTIEVEVLIDAIEHVFSGQESE